MTDFRYFAGIQEDAANMLGEIGTACTIEVPTVIYDAYGNHVSSNFDTYTETLWVRQLSEVMEVANVGQLNREDIRFEAPYNSYITVESKITYRGKKYVVVSIDKPDESGNLTHLVGLAKRELS